MNFLINVKNSIQLPKKEALFRLNRVSMRDTMVYALIFTFILVLPDIFHAFKSYQEVDYFGMPRELYFIQLIILYPATIFLFVVIGLSVLSGLAVILRNLLHRKLAFQQLWKMTAFSLTIPMIFYLIFRIFQIETVWINLLPLMIYFFLITKMILVFPRVK